MIKLIQILLDINILPKFRADWSIFADEECKQSQIQQFFLEKEQIILNILSQLDS